jgi:hypothetical protein
MFLGEIYDLHHPLPYYNTFFWTIITVPLGLLLFFAIGILSILCNIIRGQNGKVERQIGLLLFLNMITLLIIRALPNMPVHDGVRLFVVSFVFLGVIAGIGATKIWNANFKIHDETKPINVIAKKILSDNIKVVGKILSTICGVREFMLRKIILRLITCCIFGVSLLNMYWYSPQWLSYYNFLVGGLDGAVRIGMEATYYWDGFDKEVREWLNTNTAQNELVLFAKFSPDTFLIYREDGDLTADFYYLPETESNKKNVNQPSGTKKILRYYVTQNRAGAETQLDKYLKKNVKPVYTKKIRKNGFGAWNLQNVPIIEIYDLKSLQPKK